MFYQTYYLDDLIESPVSFASSPPPFAVLATSFYKRENRKDMSRFNLVGPDGDGLNSPDHR